MHAPDTTAATTPSDTASAPGALRRSVSNTLKGSAGNLVEWFDVYVYSVFAVYFESKFLWDRGGLRGLCHRPDRGVVAGVRGVPG